MVDSQLHEFVDAVIYDHGIATGLKSCNSDQDIVHFAQTQGFVFSQSHWDDFVKQDLSLLSPEDLSVVSNTATDHWTWAFRRIKPWRDMLMPGA